MLVNKGEAEGTRARRRIGVVSAEMRRSVATIKGMMWNKVVRFHPPHGGHGCLREATERTRPQAAPAEMSFPRVGELIPRETRVKLREEEEHVEVVQDVFLGRNGPPSTPRHRHWGR